MLVKYYIYRERLGLLAIVNHLVCFQCLSRDHVESVDLNNVQSHSLKKTLVNPLSANKLISEHICRESSRLPRLTLLVLVLL